MVKPNDVIRNMHKHVFGSRPSTWLKGISNPIPKDCTKGRRVPLNYRGITLASAVYKLYCSVLNSGLVKWAEDNDLISDEENGFHEGRSCLDHIVSHATITESRKVKTLRTVAAFIYLSIAYDKINRTRLLLKLERLNMFHKMLRTIWSLR